MNALADIDGFCKIQRHDGAIALAQQTFDFARGGLFSDERDEPVRIDQRHRRVSAAASSWRALLRSSAEEARMRVLSAPRAAAMGSSGRGRTTTRSPKSSIPTALACQRCRTTSVNGEICCPRAVPVNLHAADALSHLHSMNEHITLSIVRIHCYRSGAESTRIPNLRTPYAGSSLRRMFFQFPASILGRTDLN